MKIDSFRFKGYILMEKCLASSERINFWERVGRKS